MRKAIIIHGWAGSPDENWFQWLRKELEMLRYEVETPQMPNSDNPKLAEWMERLEALNPDEETLLIGHSLSNALIMRHLEKSDSKACGAVMVAVWDWLIEDFREYHETFFETDFDYELIKSKKVPLVIVNSTDDPYIDLDQSRGLGEKLGSKFVVIENAGHFNEKAGYTKFPRMLEIIKENFC